MAKMMMMMVPHRVQLSLDRHCVGEGDYYDNNDNCIQRRNARFFNNLLTAPRTESNPGAIVCKSCATHRALITCNLLCHVPRGTKGQLKQLSLAEFKSYLFSFILLAEALNR